MSELASMKHPKNSLQLPKPTADTQKIQNKVTTVGSGEKDLQITCKTILTLYMFVPYKHTFEIAQI